jgi:hypothetical protein
VRREGQRTGSNQPNGFANPDAIRVMTTAATSFSIVNSVRT